MLIAVIVFLFFFLHFWLQCSEEDLKTVFAQFGAILEVNIPRKPGTNEPSLGVDCIS